jgi:hypothetical protein
MDVLRVMEKQSAVLHLLHEVEEDRPPVLDEDESLDDGSGGSRIVCKACGALVTHGRSRMEVGGRHVHVFFNPHGLVFEVGCFSRARCGLVGARTNDFTWFPGHGWRIAMCNGCGSHLGWHFAGDSSGFYGLVLDSLREESEGEDD